MTREEREKAISHLNDMLMWEAVKADKYNALKTAIKSLEQEPCEDCISRQFMYEIGATCIATRNENGKLIALGAIEELPSVTPQEPKTNWIPCSVRTPETDDLYYVTENFYDNIGCTTEEWRDGDWVNLAEWEKVIAWMPIPDAYEESEINDERR